MPASNLVRASWATVDTQSDDRRLVGRMLSGEEAAFEEFFDGFFPQLFRFALARVDRDADIAEEVVQAALCRVIATLHTYRGEAALFTWLCTDLAVPFFVSAGVRVRF